MTILKLVTLPFPPNPPLSALFENVSKTKHKLCFVQSINSNNGRNFNEKTQAARQQ